MIIAMIGMLWCGLLVAEQEATLQQLQSAQDALALSISKAWQVSTGSAKVIAELEDAAERVKRSTAALQEMVQAAGAMQALEGLHASLRAQAESVAEWERAQPFIEALDNLFSKKPGDKAALAQLKKALAPIGIDVPLVGEFTPLMLLALYYLRFEQDANGAIVGYDKRFFDALGVLLAEGANIDATIRLQTGEGKPTDITFAQAVIYKTSNALNPIKPDVQADMFNALAAYLSRHSLQQAYSFAGQEKSRLLED